MIKRYQTKTYVTSFVDPFTGEYVEHVIEVDDDYPQKLRWIARWIPRDPWADSKNDWILEGAPF